MKRPPMFLSRAIPLALALLSASTALAQGVPSATSEPRAVEVDVHTTDAGQALSAEDALRLGLSPDAGDTKLVPPSLTADAPAAWPEGLAAHRRHGSAQAAQRAGHLLRRVCVRHVEALRHLGGDAGPARGRVPPGAGHDLHGGGAAPVRAAHADGHPHAQGRRGPVPPAAHRARARARRRHREPALRPPVRRAVRRGRGVEGLRGAGAERGCVLQPAVPRGGVRPDGRGGEPPAPGRPGRGPRHQTTWSCPR